MEPTIYEWRPEEEREEREEPQPEQLSIKLLMQILDPYHTLSHTIPREFWRSTDGVTRELVQECLNNHVLKEEYFSGIQKDDWTLEDHAARIAWMVAKGWSDPIELDFGIPSQGHSWYPLLDGHHRLAAAIFREDPWILANCSGDVEEIDRYRYFEHDNTDTQGHQSSGNTTS